MCRNNNYQIKIDELTSELSLAHKEIYLENIEKGKRADELVIANKELFFENKEKVKRADELVIANKELLFQNKEKGKRADELVIANKELLFQNKEKGKRADELVIANKELSFQNKEKGDRADELVIAKKELSFQNKEKSKRASELLTLQHIVKINVENQRRADEVLLLKDELYIEKQILEKTMMLIGEGVISTDENKNIMFLNRMAESLTGWTLAEATGKSIYEVLNLVDTRTRDKSEDIIKNVMISGEIESRSSHSLLITKDKKEIWIEDTVAPILDKKSEVFGVVIIFRDFTERLEEIKENEYLIFHDELTGVYNRRFYEKKLKRIDIKQNLPISLIMGDLNGLKLINDSLGHQKGDEFLIKVTDSIKKECGINDVIARVGGDEFIIILPRTKLKDSKRIIERIQNNMALENIGGINISVSFGCFTKTEEKQNIENLFKSVEDRMYRNKLYEKASSRSKTIDVISSTLFAKSNRELKHSKAVSELSGEIAIKMGFEVEAVKTIKLAGLMHDIGKIGIDDKILSKKGKLTNEEFSLIKEHPEIGYRILSSAPDLTETAKYVLEHHEKWDGTGYPQGLKGDKIKIEARIISIADAYSAMTNHRTYGEVLSKDEAILEIERCSGTQFDPSIVKIFINELVQNI